MSDTSTSTLWMTLVVGNTRLHWGLFEDQTLVAVRHTPHLVTVDDIQALIGSGFSYEDKRRPRSLWIASVVPAQTTLCLESPFTCWVADLSHIPLANLYPTLGIDRAINLLGAKTRVGWPVLVIDAGTALTFTTGSSQNGRAALYGGTILPGLRLQLEALGRGASALSSAAAIQSHALFERNLRVQADLPERWACDTDGAIASGLIYGAIANIADSLTDWWQQFPRGKAVLTGGDSPQLYRYLQQKTPELASRVYFDSDLMFYGMRVYRESFLAERLA